jgi:phosphonoacetaldehyde hydrolase
MINQLSAVVFDWAGTMVDFGSRAPAAVFIEVFRRRGVAITSAEARAPMGMAKREHIAALAAMPEVHARWVAAQGQPAGDADIDEMYDEFLPLQLETLSDHCDLIPGAAEAAEACRALGCKLGSSTGYTHELMEIVLPAAAEQGYAPDCCLCAGDTAAGRPAPWLLFRAAEMLNVYPMARILKVDDTLVGIEAGRNAGAWTAGITRTGNLVGLSEAELAALPSAEQQMLVQAAHAKFTTSGAHYVVESVADIPQVVTQINRRLAAGERP